MIKKIISNKIINNIGWLVIDKFLILFLQFFVGVKIANHYGNEIYGEYSYAVAIVAFSPIFLNLINDRVIKEYYNSDFNKTVSVVTTFRNILGVIIFIGLLFLYPFLKNNMTLYILLILLTFDNFLSTMTTGIENYFEYRLLSKNIVISNNIVKVLSYILQYIGIMIGYSILMIPIIRIFGSFLRMLILRNFYYKIFKEKVKVILDKYLIKKIIKESYYLWISLVAFTLYSQIDKIMIGEMLGVGEVGIYSIAIQLSNVLAILIIPFQNSIYSKLMIIFKENYKEYIELYTKINIMFTQLYIVLGLTSIIIVKYLFLYVYTNEYLPAIDCYIILVISVIIKANAALQMGHMVLKKITKKSFYKTLTGLLMNTFLNYILIPRYGIKGAAIATSITHLITAFLMDYFIKDYKEQFFIQLKSFNMLSIFKKENRNVF